MKVGTPTHSLIINKQKMIVRSFGATDTIFSFLKPCEVLRLQGIDIWHYNNAISRC